MDRRRSTLFLFQGIMLGKRIGFKRLTRDYEQRSVALKRDIPIVTGI